MKNYKVLLESINVQLKEAEEKAKAELAMREEEARRLAAITEISAANEEVVEATEEPIVEFDDPDTHYRASPAIQSFLALPLIKNAIDISGFDMFMEENYSGAVFDICEAAYIFAKDYKQNFSGYFSAMKFRPSPMIREKTNLDEMGREFYTALEQAFQMGF